MKEKAKTLLLQTKKTPAMFASNKETMIMRVTTILEMALEDFDVHGFYDKFFKNNFDEEFDNDWVVAIVDNAMTYLQD